MKSTKCNRPSKMKDKKENNLHNNCKKNNKKFNSCSRIKLRHLEMYSYFFIQRKFIKTCIVRYKQPTKSEPMPRHKSVPLLKTIPY